MYVRMPYVRSYSRKQPLPNEDGHVSTVVFGQGLPLDFFNFLRWDHLARKIHQNLSVNVTHSKVHGSSHHYCCTATVATLADEPTHIIWTSLCWRGNIYTIDIVSYYIVLATPPAIRTLLREGPASQRQDPPLGDQDCHCSPCCSHSITTLASLYYRTF